MRLEPSQELTAPNGLRPAQLGIVFVGRVILGHIGATVADLAQRGYLRLEEVPGADQADWVLTDLRGVGVPAEELPKTLSGHAIG